MYESCLPIWTLFRVAEVGTPFVSHYIQLPVTLSNHMLFSICVEIKVSELGEVLKA